MRKHLSPIERMIDQACGYNSSTPKISFTAEQEKILKELSEHSPIQFAIGTGAVVSFIDVTQPPDHEVASIVIEFLQEFMKN